MSLSRYLIHDFFTAREFNRRDAQRRSDNRAARSRRRQLSQRERDRDSRLEAVEEDLGQAVLLVRALADLCLEKGVLDGGELLDLMERLDAADGEADGKASFAEPDKPDAQPDS